jgi:hypothetical protein
MRLANVCNFLAAVAVVGVLLFGSSDSRAALRLMGASGAVTLSNSREGAAILNGARLRPGMRSSGSVTIGNPGASGTRLALEVASESESAGSGGARIWDRLRISISDGAAVVYEGRVAGLGRLPLGALGSGAQRTYTMTAWVPSGANDNALQGARLSLRFTWLAESTTTPAPPEPTPVPPTTPIPPTAPVPPATPTAPGPATTADPAAAVTAEKLISLPPARQCLSRRTVRVKIKPPRGVRVKSVVSTVNGKKNSSAKGAKTTVTLRGLPKGKVKVKVTATLTTGRKLTVKRTYKTCAR